MNYYDTTKEWRQTTGIDYNLWECLEYNAQKDFIILDIKKVLAVKEGERDQEDWHWILQLNNEKFVYLNGGCDYSGWDWRSNATSSLYETTEEALDAVIPDINDNPILSSYGTSIEFNLSKENLQFALRKQIENSKLSTWRENKDKEFGL